MFWPVFCIIFNFFLKKIKNLVISYLGKFTKYFLVFLCFFLVSINLFPLFPICVYVLVIFVCQIWSRMITIVDVFFSLYCFGKKVVKMFIFFWIFWIFSGMLPKCKRFPAFISGFYHFFLFFSLCLVMFFYPMIMLLVYFPLFTVFGKKCGYFDNCWIFLECLVVLYPTKPNYIQYHTHVSARRCWN